MEAKIHQDVNDQFSNKHLCGHCVAISLIAVFIPSALKKAAN